VTPRAYAVTGAASGIGAATCALLRARGQQVVGIDLCDADVVADLATPDGRGSLHDAVRAATNGVLDGVIACAGVTAPERTAISVNYFGATASVLELVPLLERSTAPRAVVVGSYSMIGEVPGTDPEIIAACLDHDEPRACAAAEGTGNVAYASAKRALARWVRRLAPELGPRGILLNAVAPATVRTPMMQPVIEAPGGLDALLSIMPMPIGRIAEPEDIAEVLAFLAGPDNAIVTGQVVFADGGTDACLRPDDVW
jgi:NAD(P)-dependent dehydrogenase (short-subunit alcohol dehydrogenase family)